MPHYRPTGGRLFSKLFRQYLRSQSYKGFKVEGLGFRKSTRAGAIVFALLLYRRLRPAAIGFGQLLLKATFHAVEHPKALLRLHFPNVDMRPCSFS
jgi:hypothetical protein